MNLSDIRLLYGHEIRGALRERNVMLYVVLVPALLYPLLLWLSMTVLTFVMGQNERTVPRIAIYGLPPACPDLVTDLKLDILGIEVTLSPTLLADLSGGQDVACNLVDTNDGLKVYILYDSSRFRSQAAQERLQSFFQNYRDRKLEAQGRTKGLALADLQLFGVHFHNLSSTQDVGRYLLGILLPVTLIVILSLGGMYSAIDCTAGERERSTWETSLTLATDRFNLILAKYLYVATMCSVAGLLNLVSMTFSLRSFVAPVFGEMANQMRLSLPMSSLPVILLGTLTLSCLLAAIMMLLASLARTFREGQALISPLFLLMLVPISLVVDKSLVFDRSTALIPVVNVAFMWRESLQGEFQADLFLITLTVCLLGVALCLLSAQFFMSQETLVLEGGAGLWKRLVPPYLRSRMKCDL